MGLRFQFLVKDGRHDEAIEVMLGMGLAVQVERAEVPSVGRGIMLSAALHDEGPTFNQVSRALGAIGVR